MNAPEWLRDLRGLPCYLLCCHTPLDRWRWAWLLLLPYAGDWVYREPRRAFKT